MHSAPGDPTSASPAVLDLVRTAAASVHADAISVFVDLHAAVAASAPDGLAEDPALAVEIERSNVSLLLAWVEANIERPLEPVVPVLTAESLDIACDIARLGIEDATYNYFRVGLGVAAKHVMAAAFAASSDPVVLRDALALMLESASTYIDRTVRMLRETIGAERRARDSGVGARRLEIVTALLGGGSITAAGARLGFELARPLASCVVWSVSGSRPAPDQLAGIARAVAAASGARPPLVVEPTASSVWSWMPTDAMPDPDVVRRVLADHPGVRVALGPSDGGEAGFRRTHEEAVRTQQVMHRMGPDMQVATHADVRVVALAGVDGPAASAFVATTLGGLAAGPEELRRTLRAVVACGHDTARVAADLGLHRNTVLARVRRARDLLPEGAAADGWIAVGLALELDRWLGSPAPDPRREG